MASNLINEVLEMPRIATYQQSNSCTSQPIKLRGRNQDRPLIAINCALRHEDLQRHRFASSQAGATQYSSATNNTDNLPHT